MRTPPTPLEWHPFYRDYTALLDWLNRPAGTSRVLIPRIEPVTISAAELYPTEPMPEPWVLEKRKAWGPAPYVGRPFVYVWRFATDQLGRAVAGEAHIVHTDRIEEGW